MTPLEKITVDKLKVPAGFKVEVWAHGMPGARMMTRGDKGTIFVGTRAIGKVYAITDKGGKRTHKVIAEGLQQPNGVAFKNGTLYVITIDKALRFDGIEDKLDSPQIDRRQRASSSCRHRRTTTGNSPPSAPTTSSTSPSARPATCARSTPACTA